MRLLSLLRGLRRPLFLPATGAIAFAALGCPAPQSPKGPPPEYEEPAAPSWLEAGAPTQGGAAAEAGAPPASSLPGPDQAPPSPAAH